MSYFKLATTSDLDFSLPLSLPPPSLSASPRLSFSSSSRPFVLSHLLGIFFHDDQIHVYHGVFVRMGSTVTSRFDRSSSCVSREVRAGEGEGQGRAEFGLMAMTFLAASSQPCEATKLAIDCRQKAVPRMCAVRMSALAPGPR